MNIWAILCPGKSLNDLDIASVRCDAGQVIAVNYAILHRRFLPSFWALMDGEVFKECVAITNPESFASQGTALWIPENFENAGQTAGWTYTHCEAYRAFAVLKFRDLDRMLAQPVLTSGIPKILWQDCTLFTAIGLAVLMGAKEIHVYGADFNGKGYFREDLPGNFRTDHRPVRWKREKQEFSRIQALLLGRGIELVQHPHENGNIKHD